MVYGLKNRLIFLVRKINTLKRKRSVQNGTKNE